MGTRRHTDLHRRNFLRMALASAAAWSAGGLPGLAGVANGAGIPLLTNRVLVNLMLEGAPDLRHLFPPPFDSNPASFGYGFWQAKAPAHGIGNASSDWQARWQNDYYEVADGGTRFGIHKSAGWLKQMWEQGKLAIVANAFGGSSRDHANCIDIIEQGDRGFRLNQPLHSGWGGRLAAAGLGNAVALTPSIRSFCYGPDGADPTGIDNSNLVAMRNSRAMSLYKPPAGVSPEDGSAVISRSLTGYYAARRQTLDPDSLYFRFVELERKLREFGEPIDARLAGTPVPDSIGALMDGGLSSPAFGEQLRNLHDAFVCSDILGLRVASMDYGGWDSHQNQAALIEPRFNDLFGTGKAMDVLFSVLPQPVLDQVVIVMAGEFGRQLRANGGNGTDHGEGTVMMVIGNAVRGGVYGEMFPQEELARLGDDSPQIRGLTALDHVFGAVCDWVVAGSGATVFPDRASAPLETGVSFSSLFA